MKKIIVDKNEGIAEVIDRILNEPDGEVSVVVPKGSALGRSVSNFHLLKREADSAGRSVVIESVDETILAFAKESGIESSHPLWKGVRGTGGFSDIVSRRNEDAILLRADRNDDEAEDDDEKDEVASKKSFKKNVPITPGRRGKKAEPPVKEEETEEDESEDREVLGEKEPLTRSHFFDATPDIDEDEEDRPARRFPKKTIWTIVGIIIIVALGAYAVSTFFDHADITINFKQTPWSYQDNFIASKNAVGIDPSNNTIPAQVFTSTKNVTESFPGSSVQQVSQKAQGTITIYNAYSAAPQELVATTRFLTPDGQIFRITQDVTVPGETKAADGTLTPSSITAPIVADQAGPDYNVGPVAKLSVPGFANDPGRAAGFYGAITASTTGGFIGQRAVPTAADIAAAKASTTATLAAALQDGFSGTYPNNFAIPDGAATTTVTTLTVNTSTDANGNFTVFGAATLQAIGFDQTALENYLLGLAQAQEASSTFKTINLSYSDVAANFTTGQISFALNAQAQLEPAFSPAQFATSVEGQGIASARSTISALPQLADGEISMWPSWLQSIPSDPAKIHITVN
jgi:hypothetical protein